MTILLIVLVIISSLSFLFYGITHFTSSTMKDEFKRFGLEKFGIMTAILELIGAVGLLVGLKENVVLLISSGGLSLLMLLGIVVRLRVKDRFLVLLPALTFMLLNLLIFFISLHFR
jgi:hypothetical protein